MSGANQVDGGAVPAPPDLEGDFRDPAGNEARFRAQLAVANRTSGDRVTLLTQVARAQGLQRAFDAAHQTLGEAERLLDGAGPHARVHSLLERGRVITSAGAPERAAPSFITAWKVAREHGEDALAVDAAHMLGIVLPPPAGPEWNHRPLALAETSTDPKARRWQGSRLNNLGWTSHDAGNFATALTLFMRAASWQNEHGTAEGRRIARWCVARTLRSLGRVTEALAQQRALRDELIRAGQDDGFVNEEIGEFLLALGRPEEAGPHIAAYAALSRAPGFMLREPDRSHRLQEQPATQK